MLQTYFRALKAVYDTQTATIGNSIPGIVRNMSDFFGLYLLKQVAPPGVKWTNHIHYTGSCIALTFLFIKPATKRDLLVNPIAAGT